MTPSSLTLLLVLLVPFAQAANSIQWINPAPGTALTPGQAVEVKWTSDQPLRNPSFSLCTADARCGQATPAKIKDNADGTTSALLAMPKMDGSQGMFLQMNDKNGGSVHQSPTFQLNAVAPEDKQARASSMNERVPSPDPRKSEEEDEAIAAAAEAEADTEAGPAESSRNPYKWEDESATETPTAGGGAATDLAGALSSLAKQASLTTDGYPVPTSFNPSVLPTAFPSQWPFSNPYGALNMTSSASSSSASASGSSASAAAAGAGQDDARPNAAIIAVPLSICGAIVLASLLFCARSRMRKQRDLEAGATGPGVPQSGPMPPPADWQTAIKRKALDAQVEKGPEGVSGVTITERRDDAMVPTLGYAQPPASCPGPRQRGLRQPPVGQYVDDTYTRYDPCGPRDGDGYGYGRTDAYMPEGRRHELPRSNYGRPPDRYEREMLRRYMGSRSLPSSSSRSDTRCLTPVRDHRDYDPYRERDRAYSRYGAKDCDREYGMQDRYTRHSRSSRSSCGVRKDRYDDAYDRPYLSTSSWRAMDEPHYFATSRRSRSGVGGIDDRCDCPSCLPSITHRDRVHARGHAHEHDCVDCSRQESIATPPRTPQEDRPSGPTYTYSRPLPEPMIRNPTSSRSSQARESDIDQDHKEKHRHAHHYERDLPHKTGALRRADSSASTASEAGWDLAGKGAYETAHGRGMGELYESLRRAIGESDGYDQHARNR